MKKVGIVGTMGYTGVKLLRIPGTHRLAKRMFGLPETTGIEHIPLLP